ncbi:hypothetical protein [uncultured Meiothermus sp.]|uniref:hypothetical protein n=1 Tax=uncultured Meiothermus sp. TaxID=157471 RepID=UPI002603B242|nr:hypothetical protein [uncultured Meiothermus sp.]
MPGHIFDANTLRNFALVGVLDLLPRILPGQLFVGATVRQELHLGVRAFQRNNSDKLGDPAWVAYMTRFQSLDTYLKGLGFRRLAVSTSVAHQAMWNFLACLADEDVMEEGEAESMTLAAFRGLVLYSDELKVFREAENYKNGLFPCPRVGQDPPPHAVEVHSSAWILLEGVEGGVLSMDDAEEIYLEMEIMWERHPKLSLSSLRSGHGRYW